MPPDRIISVSATEKLINLLEWEGTDLLRAFEKASVQGKGTPQEIADFRENYFKKFVSSYFPYPYRITKSRITDSYGSDSDSIDCIVINPVHPYTIDINEKFSIVLADGVDLAIELKPDLSAKSERIRGLEQMRTVKILTRRNNAILMKHKCSQDCIANSYKIPCFLFAIKGMSNPINMAIEVMKYYHENNVPVIEQVDYIVINNTGIISNYKYPELSKTQDKEVGMYFEEWRERTLAAFVLKMNESFPAAPRLAAPVLYHYLGNIRPYALWRVNLRTATT